MSANGALLDAFRHNVWATRELIAFCRALPHDQLEATSPGAFGSILETFDHLVRSDAGYLGSLSGERLPWAAERIRAADLDAFAARTDEAWAGWERLLSEPLDGERVLILDAGAYQAHAGVLIAQALHHGSLHREQICATLTRLGLQPPDLQAWAYADATGRGGPRATEN